MSLSTIRRRVGTGVLTGVLTALATGMALIASVSVASSASAVRPDQDYFPVTPVASLDLARYAGTWLQLADVPASFTAQCDRDTQAKYTVLPDGLVQVINTCVRADGSLNTIEGRARVVGPDSNAQLQVTFVQIAGEWQFRAAGDYWVVGLDEENYSSATRFAAMDLCSRANLP
jgi:apolipoprotein D and lipocalin family protein